MSSITRRSGSATEQFRSLHSDKYSDLTLEFEGKSWNIHKIIVCRQSEWFDKAISEGFKVRLLFEDGLKVWLTTRAAGRSSRIHQA